jgi:hypothetical protein
MYSLQAACYFRCTEEDFVDMCLLAVFCPLLWAFYTKLYHTVNLSLGAQQIFSSSTSVNLAFQERDDDHHYHQQNNNYCYHNHTLYTTYKRYAAMIQSLCFKCTCGVSVAQPTDFPHSDGLIAGYCEEPVMRWTVHLVYEALFMCRKAQNVLCESCVSLSFVCWSVSL